VAEKEDTGTSGAYPQEDIDAEEEFEADKVEEEFYGDELDNEVLLIPIR